MRVKEVRSGEVKYCVLGVGCEVSGLGVWKEHIRRGMDTGRERDVFRYEISKEHSRGLAFYETLSTNQLPVPVRDYYGLRTVNGIFSVEERSATLDGRNDGGASFEALADIIEAEPPELLLKDLQEERENEV